MVKHKPNNKPNGETAASEGFHLREVPYISAWVIVT